MSNLRRHLHLLQRALPGVDGIRWISSDGPRLSWNEHAPVWVDLHAFDSLIADEARQAEAIEFYRGPLLGTSAEPIAAALRDRTRSACIDACRDLALAARRRCDLTDAIRYVDRILAMEAGREDALRLGMALRYESGDRSSALAFFERFAERLRDEMGIDPMPETLALRDSILMNRVAETGDRSAAEPSAPESRALVSPFVGRNREFTALDEAWREARRGKGSTVFVGGEAGMGKSRLLSEFSSHVASLGGRVIIGTTSNPERHPFEPLVDALRKSLAMLVESPIAPPWLSTIADLLPELRAAFHDIPAVESLEPEHARARLLEALARAFEQLAKVRPLLLVLEDLHWGNRSTLDAIESLARRVGGVPALMVITYRIGDSRPGGELQAMRRNLLDEGRAAALVLPPLSFDDVSSLVRGTQAGAASDAIAEPVYAVSEGNPLFVLQLLRGFLENGTICDGSTAVTTLGQAIEARVASLDAFTQEILGVAATVGRSFTLEMLAAIVGYPEAQVFDALGELLDRCLIRATPGSTFAYSFAHELIAKAVYDSLPQRQRTLYHRRVAAVLSTWEGTEPLALASIARQWELGGDRNRAGRTYARAARGALDAHAPHEAIAYARSATEFGEDPRSRFETLALIAVAERRVPDRERWEEDLRALSSAADVLGAEERFTALAEWAWHFAHVGKEQEERRVIASMLALAQSLGPSKLGEAWFAAGMLEFHLGRFEASIKPFERALHLALAAGERLIEARSRGYLSRIFFPLGRDREAIDHYDALCRLVPGDEPSTDLLHVRVHARSNVAIAMHDIALASRAGTEMLALAERLGDRKLAINGNNLSAFASRWTKTLAECRALHLRTSELCREIDYARGVIIGETNRSTTEAEFGFAQESLQIIAAIASDARRLGDETITVKLLCNRAVALTNLDDSSGAIEAGRMATGVAHTLDARMRAVADMALGGALCAAGDYAAGLPFVESAVDLDRNTGSDARLVEFLSQFVMFLDEAGQLERLRVAASELASLNSNRKRPLWIRHPSRVAYALARAAARAGRSAQSDAHYIQGRAALATEIRRLGEDARGALERLPFNRALLHTARTRFGCQ
jgi:DNA-binding SARP family transcriptional activator/tetratricopeptide (TPR) repeat protein